MTFKKRHGKPFSARFRWVAPMRTRWLVVISWDGSRQQLDNNWAAVQDCQKEQERNIIVQGHEWSQHFSIITFLYDIRQLFFYWIRYAIPDKITHIHIHIYICIFTYEFISNNCIRVSWVISLMRTLSIIRRFHNRGLITVVICTNPKKFALKNWSNR